MAKRANIDYYEPRKMQKSYFRPCNYQIRAVEVTKNHTSLVDNLETKVALYGFP